MPALKIAIQLKSLRLPLKSALKRAAELGALGVEIDARHEVHPQEMSGTGLRQFRKLLDDLNLHVAAVAYPTRRGFDVAEDLQQRVEGTKHAMRFAHDLRAAVVINQIGRLEPQAADAPVNPARRQLIEVLHDLGRFGHHVGALFAAQTGTESGRDLADLLREVPQGTVGVSLNPGNLIINGFSPREAVEALGPSILHVHATDAVRDLARGRGLEVPLGRGVADFPALLGGLEEHNYRGYFTIERSASDDPIFEIGQAVQYLRNIAA